MMPGLRETVANLLSPRDEAPTVQVGQEVAYSESLFNSSAAAFKYDPDQLKSRKGADIYRRMMLDEQVKAVVRFRRDAITGREFYFAFDPDVDLSEEEQKHRIGLFKSITEQMAGSFNDGLNAIMVGVHQGFSITEKVHDVIDYKGKPYIGLSKLKQKPHDTFKFQVDRYGNIKKLEQDLDGEIRSIPIEKVIHYVQNPEVDEHYGGSELRECYRAWFAKDVAIKFWNIYLERAAGGLWVARPKDGTVVIQGSKEHQAILNILGRMSSSSAVLLPASIEVEFIQPSTTSEFESAIQYHDLAIAKSLLVPNLLGLSHSGQTGAFAQSKTQFQAFMLVLEADTVRLESSCNEQVFRELGEINFADGIWPKLKFKPLSIEQIIELLKTWNELVGSDTVEPSDTDESHIRQLLDMPEKGEPLPRRPAITPFPPPGNDPDPTGPPNNNPHERTPDEVIEARDRAAWKVSFTRAMKRVRFTVIDRQSTDLTAKEVIKLREVVTRNVSELMDVVTEQKLGTPEGDIQAIGKLSLKASQKNRFKNTINRALTQSWKIGEKHATDEIGAARGTTFTQVNMRRLEDNAADYFGAKAFSTAGSLTADIEDIIKNTLQNGIKFSWTQREITDQIYKTLLRKGMMIVDDAVPFVSLDERDLIEALEGAGLKAHRLETMIRTTVFDAINEARYNMFTDPALGDFVQAMEYSAILDSRTTNICRNLDGKTFAKESDLWEKYRPPNHFNCRSILIAVTDADTWKESRPPTIEPQGGFGDS
jgi:SPP1 gp7 family putative phage head morphogenesis protein